MGQTYPAPPPAINGDEITIHRLLASPQLIQRRLRTLAEQRFIADALLTGRLEAEGGAVWYEQGESLYTNDDPEVVAPGAEYPQTGVGVGPTQVAAVQKWGQDVPVTDESIKRHKRNPVDRAFTKLINQMVRKVDSISIAAIASQVTNGDDVTTAWTDPAVTVEQIFRDVALGKAFMHGLAEGFDPDTIALTETVWANVMAKMVGAGVLPRESRDTALITGEFPVIAGLRWLTSPHVPDATGALMVDTDQLGGMADENLGGPGYTGSLAGVQGKSIRDEKKDGWLLRARRVTVPVVLEPAAAYELRGVSA